MSYKLPPQVPYIATDLSTLRNGTVIRYKRKLYFVSGGLDERILTRHDTGQWLRIDDLKWSRFTIVYKPIL